MWSVVVVSDGTKLQCIDMIWLMWSVVVVSDGTMY